MPTQQLTRHRQQQPKVGISACLTGENVRYDGGNKYHQLIQQELSPWLNLQPICPEAEAGLGIPRPPVQLVQRADGIYAQGVTQTQLDVTNVLVATSAQLANNCGQRFCAYIVKARSPSCGAGSTPIYNSGKTQVTTGDGLFVKTLKATLPNIMIVEESRFSNAEKCKEFVLQCYQLQVKDRA